MSHLNGTADTAGYPRTSLDDRPSVAASSLTPPHHDVEKASDPSKIKDPNLEEYPTLAPQETIHEGELKYSRLGWKRLTICLIVEAIALGSLSIPSAFATLGMVAGVIVCVGLGLVAIYTSYVVGQVKLKYPHVDHYADGVRLIWGKFGYELVSAMFVVYLTLLVGSHALTGTIAFVRIADQPGLCALVWGVISAILRKSQTRGASSVTRS